MSSVVVLGVSGVGSVEVGVVDVGLGLGFSGSRVVIVTVVPAKAAPVGVWATTKAVLVSGPVTTTWYPAAFNALFALSADIPLVLGIWLLVDPLMYGAVAGGIVPAVPKLFFTADIQVRAGSEPP